MGEVILGGGGGAFLNNFSKVVVLFFKFAKPVEFLFILYFFLKSLLFYS